MPNFTQNNGTFERFASITSRLITESSMIWSSVLDRRVSSDMMSLCSFALAIALAVQAPSLAQDADGKDAEKPESSKEALVLYAEAAGYQNNQQFDLAGVEWAKFLKGHSDDPRALEARYNLAVCELQQKNFEEAVKHLAIVVKDADDDFERLEDAYLNLGWCEYSVALENKPKYFARATETFKQLLDKYPKGSFRDQALFFGGESLYLQGKFAEAADSYAQLVEKHTDSDLHSDAMYALGVTKEDMRQFGPAKEVYTSFLKTYPKHDLAMEVKMRRAETILQTGEFEEAAGIFKEVAESRGFKAVDHARYRQAFCVAAMAERLAAAADKNPNWRADQAKGYVNAAKIFGKVAEDMPQSPYAKDAAIAAGRAYYRAKKFDDAAKWFKQIKDSDSPHAPEAAHWMARILLDQHKPSDARNVVASVMKAAERHPFLVSLKLDDADALYQVKATQKDSVNAYLKIYNDHKDHRLAPKALYNAAYGAMEVQDYKKGLTFSEQFNTRFAKHPLAPEVQKVLAECKLQLGDHEDAAKVYKDLAASGDKDGMKFELRRGLSLVANNDHDAAIPILDKVFNATDSPKEKAESAYWLGRSYAAKNQHPKAIAAFESSREAMPNWQQADEVLLNLGRSYRRTGKLDQALKTVTSLVSKYPKSQVLDQAHYRLGEFAYAKSDFKAATASYSKLLSDWPSSKLAPFGLYGRGWSYLRSGDAQKGNADFAQLQKEHPNHELSKQAVYARGMAQHQLGDHQGALERVDEYLGTKPTGSGRSDALYLRGLALVGLQKPSEAVTVFDALLKTDANYASKDKVLYELAWAHKNSKDDAKSLETFRKLLADSPKSSLAAEAHYHVGEDFYNNKTYDKAVTSYTSAATMASTKDLREKAFYKLGWARYQTQKYEQALDSFDKQLAVSESGNLAADAEFMRGECLFKQDRFKDAFAAYERAKNKPSRNTTMQVLTLLHGGQAAAQLKDWEASAQWIAELQKKFPKSAYMPQAIYEQGWAQRNLGQLPQALKSFQQVSAAAPRNELGARGRFMTGEVLFEQKNYTAAILEFRRVMFGYGADKATDAIKQWQAKSAFEAGRCATVLAGQEQNPQRRNQLIEGAKGFFQYVIEKHPRAPEVPTAKEQLRRLGPQRQPQVSTRPEPAADAR